MTDFEQLKQKIGELKEELRAVIVAHNYQRPEIQDIADFVGDSLELSRQCTEVDAPTIVFYDESVMVVRAPSAYKPRTPHRLTFRLPRAAGSAANF